MKRTIGSLAATVGVCVFLAALMVGLNERSARAQSTSPPLPFAVTLSDPGTPFTFPGARRATVQFVSGKCDVQLGQMINVSLVLGAHPRAGDPRNASHSLVPVLTATDGNVNYYSFAQPMTAYGGVGTTLRLVSTPTSGSAVSCSAAVAGFSEPLQ